MPTPIDAMLDHIEWTQIEFADGLPPKGLYATHKGVLQIADLPPLHVARLNNGQRVFEAESFERFLGVWFGDDHD